MPIRKLTIKIVRLTNSCRFPEWRSPLSKSVLPRAAVVGGGPNLDLEDAVDGAGQDDPRRVGVIQSKAAGIVRLCVKQISKQSSCAFFILGKLL